MKKPEKLCRRSTSPSERRAVKRRTRRLRRRLERFDLEAAPTKIRELTRGWTE